MTDDLGRRLRRLDDVPAPDLWARVGMERERPSTHPTPIRRAAIAVTALALAAAAFVFLASTFRAGPVDERLSVLALPDDPCALLTREQVAAATGSAVLSAGVLPDERFMVPVDPNPCGYETDGRFGQVIVTVEQGRRAFIEARDRDPRNTQPLESIGDEAFVHGGADLWVLVGDGSFSIEAQHGAGDAAVSMLQTLARDALANLAVPSTPSPPAAPKADLDPTAICQVPEYDPTVAMLGDDAASVFGGVGPRAFPLDVLEAAGEPGSSIRGTATDELRSYLASPDARYAPSEGWRTIDETADEILFAAPPDGGYSDWWVVRFERGDKFWRPRETELVDQFRTPAQRGHDLALSWTGDVTLSDGSWTSELVLTNEGAGTWTDDNQAPAIWGHAHMFDPTTGLEVSRTAETAGDWGAGVAVPANESVSVPLSLGGQLGAMDPGVYDVVACVPRLGLASPIGSLRVVDDPTMTDVRVLTYPYTGASLAALGGGRLVDHNGCLAVADAPDDPRPTYVLWPDGYALVARGGRMVLIDAVGNEIAEMGDQIRLGGGYGTFAGSASSAIGGIPASCQTGGEGYFITGGPA
ncbi:MAG: hypothetical protein ABI635_07510 [Actinomycetota bacterium]